jgi:RNA polymerase sigma factor (sigma-70 family)
MSPAGFPRLHGVQSDQRLLALARDGDECAFEAFVRRYRRALLRYCRRMGLSDSRAEDAVQQALLRAWLALERGAEVHAPKAWLYRTVHNTAVNVMRGAREHGPLEERALVDVAASAESDFERRVAVRETLSHVAGLPRMQREAILLTAFDGRSHEEIAVALGVTHGAVRGLLYRARATLRDAAAAVCPAPVALWAGGLLGRITPPAAKLAEVSAPAGNSDLGGLLAKGAALAATAAVLAVGTGVVPLPRHLAHRSKAAAQALGIATATAEAQTSESSAGPAGPAPERAWRRAADSVAGRRSATRRPTVRAPARPVGSDGGGRFDHGSGGDGASSASEATLQHGGEDDLAKGRGGERQPVPGSDGLQATEPSQSDSSGGGLQCEHCSGTSGGRDEASHRSEAEPSAPTSTPPTTSAVSPSGSGEALIEPQSRD